LLVFDKSSVWEDNGVLNLQECFIIEELPRIVLQKNKGPFFY